MIVLDLMLPGEDGLSICRRLRAGNDSTPIIMLTAKVEDVDRIVGLEVGADDYLPKPFNPRELLARIHAVLRRRPAQEAPGAPSKEAQVVQFGPFEFDLSLRRLTKEGELIALTTGEFSMLKALVRHPRQPLVARQAGPAGARPGFRTLRPQPGRAGVAPAQADRARPLATALHPDGVGRGLCLRARWWQLKRHPPIWGGARPRAGHSGVICWPHTAWH